MEITTYTAVAGSNVPVRTIATLVTKTDSTYEAMYSVVNITTAQPDNAIHAAHTYHLLHPIFVN